MNLSASREDSSISRRRSFSGVRSVSQGLLCNARNELVCVCGFLGRTVHEHCPFFKQDAAVAVLQNPAQAMRDKQDGLAGSPEVIEPVETFLLKSSIAD